VPEGIKVSGCAHLTNSVTHGDTAHHYRRYARANVYYQNWCHTVSRQPPKARRVFPATLPAIKCG